MHGRDKELGYGNNVWGLGNPQCYCLRPCLYKKYIKWLGYDRHSETERVLVSDEGFKKTHPELA